MSHLKILHLEDDPHDAQLMEWALKRGGIEPQVVLVQSRAEFCAALDRESFDVVLSDNSLGDFDALSALAVARQRQPGIPFVCASGAAEPDRVLASLNAGANDYVLKEHPWQLVAAMRQVIAARQRRRELEGLQHQNAGMHRLVAAVQELSLARNLDSIMAIVRTAARELTGADGATFVLRDGDLCHYADEDAISPLWKGQRFPMSACISGWAMLHREPAIIEDIYADPRIPADAYRPTFVKSLAMVPIRTEAPIGAIGNYWASRHSPTPTEVSLLQALANTTSVAMENVQLYAELEQRVKDRTLQLEAANQELEAFSYSVSHDLRAPLRAVSGYAEMLHEDCGAALSESGRKHLATVRAEARRMGRLIDDLLRLARLARADLHRSKVDLATLAREIIAGLQRAAPERHVECLVPERLEVQGDSGLLRVVLENLLSNAWKYSSRTGQARIELGEQESTDAAPTYFVRDNGAGFDMNHARKLFTPFQRLHRDEEFPGTGVGLATVHRIIHRHGGRIWAEAEPGQGATFFFTLG
jgi:signal transduction histidine kinase/CheY-like chemotaxis protein